MKKFAGRVAFVTGGASGIGYGLVQKFLKLGMKVVVADFNRDHLQAVAGEMTASWMDPVELGAMVVEGYSQQRAPYPDARAIPRRSARAVRNARRRLSAEPADPCRAQGVRR